MSTNKIKLRDANGTQKLDSSQPAKKVTLGKTKANLIRSKELNLGGEPIKTPENDAHAPAADRRESIIYQTSRIKLGTESIPLDKVYHNIRFFWYCGVPILGFFFYRSYLKDFTKSKIKYDDQKTIKLIVTMNKAFYFLVLPIFFVVLFPWLQHISYKSSFKKLVGV